ncbi:hypothetical protein M407DRAFT_53628, partial [Tulasnella calospora MUT 4182]
TGAALGGPLRGHSSFVNSVCFSPDGKYLASGSSDSTIRLWNCQTGVEVGEPCSHHWRTSVQSVCFSPDGKLLASGAYEKTIWLSGWDPNTGVQRGTPFTGDMKDVSSVSFSSDGRLLLARYRDGSPATWD